jgi:hypothetical protein
MHSMSRYISQRTLVTTQVTHDIAASLGMTADQCDLVSRAAQLRAADRAVEYRQLLAGAQPQLSAAATALVGADSDLGGSVDLAAQVLRTATSDVIVAAAISASRSPDLGARHVEVSRGDRVVTILATLGSGNSLLMVNVDRDAGTIEREWKLGPGDECEVLDELYVNELAESGVLVETVALDQHGGRRDGSRLIDPAFAVDPEHPTVGAVRLHEDRPGVRRTAQTEPRRAASARREVAG